MTQEEKVLLLKDLSARLRYGVKVTYNISGSHYEEISTICGCELRYDDLTSFKLKNGLVVGCNIKPYLRPMSSMTEEEKKVVCSMNMISDTELNDRLNYQRMYVQNYTIETFDYFNEHKLDYRGLIPLGLAIEAPEGMYKTD